MPRPTPTVLSRLFVAASAVALIAAPVLAREIAAAPANDRATEADALTIRIAALESRIAELEALNAAPTRVQAPFIVVDGAGKTLLRIDRSPKNNGARLTVGDSVGSAAIIVAGPLGGSIQLVDPTNKVRVGAIGSQNDAGVNIFARGGKAFMGATSDGVPTFRASNLGDQPVAELKQSLAHNGLLLLTNEAGEVVVLAGTSDKGTGVVKAGPAGYGPSALLGNAGLWASEISGRKR